MKCGVIFPGKTSDIYIPVICLVEIVYLCEKGRIPAHLKVRLDDALQAATSGLMVANLTAEIANAVTRVPRANVPDMPDRIIAATALHLGLDLISKDPKIRAAGVNTIW